MLNSEEEAWTHISKNLYPNLTSQRIAVINRKIKVPFPTLSLLGKHESWQPASVLKSWLFCVESVKSGTQKSQGTCRRPYSGRTNAETQLPGWDTLLPSYSPLHILDHGAGSMCCSGLLPSAPSPPLRPSGCLASSLDFNAFFAAHCQEVTLLGCCD